MNRNNYDSDITTWSPHGRLFQMEYALQAVKQGGAAIGLKSKDFAVLATLKRSNSELSSHQRKIMCIDDHVGIALSGLIADARVLCKFMRTECLQHKFVYESPVLTQRLCNLVADKMQVHTQRYGRRPYGVGLLCIGHDQTGAHLYELSPSGNAFDYKAMAIGARAQSAKTYLEKTYESFADCNMEQLIHHALFALRETLGTASEGLTIDNAELGIVGLGQEFKIIDGDDIKPYLEALDKEGEGEDAADGDGDVEMSG